MTKFLFSLAWFFLTIASGVLAAKPASGSRLPEADFENRCGWVDNPTPANWTLTDRDETWLIGAQGGHQAAGDVPEFPESGKYWVKTNGYYGYGCACLQMKVDKQTKIVLQIKRGQALPLAKCKADKSLKPH